MSRTSPTPILLDTSILSQIVTDILAVLQIDPAKKSICLGKAAARIAGPKHNWGFLTGHQGQVTAIGVKSTPEHGPADRHIPSHISEGARLALLTLTGADAANLDFQALMLASAFQSAVPHAAEVFTSAEQVKNDIVHNRGHLIAAATARATELDLMNQEGNALVTAALSERRPMDPVGNNLIGGPAMSDWSALLRNHLEVEIPQIDFNHLPYPSRESLAKVDEIIEESRATQEMVSRIATPAGTYPVAGIIGEDRLETFIDFLAQQKMHPKFMAYVRQNMNIVRLSVLTGRLTPNLWHKAGLCITHELNGEAGDLTAFDLLCRPAFGDELSNAILSACGISRAV